MTERFEGEIVHITRTDGDFPPDIDGDTCTCGAELEAQYGFADCGLGVFMACWVCGAIFNFTPDPECMTACESERWTAHIASKGTPR